MKYYSQYRCHDLFELQQSLSGLSKENRWVKLADSLPWDKIEKDQTDNIWAKLAETAATWIGACIFAKNIMKFLRGLLCLLFEKSAFFWQKTGFHTRNYFLAPKIAIDGSWGGRNN